MANDNTISPPDQRAGLAHRARLRSLSEFANFNGLVKREFDVKALRIIVDLDNTIADEFGRRVRPGMVEFLETLAADGHQLVLWTSSTGQRARAILAEHDLERHFGRVICREDYDDSGPKNIAEIGGHAIIDDDPAQIDAATATGALGLLITPYRGGPDPNPGELDEILKQLRRLARAGLWGWLGR